MRSFFAFPRHPERLYPVKRSSVSLMSLLSPVKKLLLRETLQNSPSKIVLSIVNCLINIVIRYN